MSKLLFKKEQSNQMKYLYQGLIDVYGRDTEFNPDEVLIFTGEKNTTRI